MVRIAEAQFPYRNESSPTPPSQPIPVMGDTCLDKFISDHIGDYSVHSLYTGRR